ncbi:uncharacterized protein SCHCODRAFT_02580239, partial [Schizophyllum commune H4-8]|uniref:uncharacterized protein n=1 Tax=Schizophyllum commune (strain H4-8 / FGSC 9210) TaxID=578458 RepID=UPI00215EB207
IHYDAARGSGGRVEQAHALEVSYSAARARTPQLGDNELNGSIALRLLHLIQRPAQRLVRRRATSTRLYYASRLPTHTYRGVRPPSALTCRSEQAPRLVNPNVSLHGVDCPSDPYNRSGIDAGPQVFAAEHDARDTDWRLLQFTRSGGEIAGKAI